MRNLTVLELPREQDYLSSIKTLAKLERQHLVQANKWTSHVLSAGGYAATAAREFKVKVVLVSHQNQWAQTFEALKSEVMALLGPCLQTVEHFGSTSIQGIAAKPIIDMIGTVASLTHLDEILSAGLPTHIKNLGENGVTGRRYLVFENALRKNYAHFHLFESGHPAYFDRIAFRDYLRANDVVARQYEALKRGLAERFPNDPLSYWKGKAEFVETALANAKRSENHE